MTTSVINNSVFRGFFEKQKLTGPIFIDWYRQLRIVLSVEDKLNYLEHHIPVAPILAHDEYNMHSMGKTINELHDMLKLHEQTLPKNNAPAFHAIRARKGKNKLAYVPKPKIPPPPKREDPSKDSICHQCGETCHWKRNCHNPRSYELYIDAEEHELRDLGEPANYKAALLNPESVKWLNAMNVEMQSMKDDEVWDLVDVPPNGKIVGSKWLFKKKTDMDRAIHTYKAHLVAKGYNQTSWIDYEETFSPVAGIKAIIILIAIAVFYDYEIWQIDVKNAFLNGYLFEEQASRQWNKRFDDEIKKFGFTENHDEPCVYLKASRSNVTFLILCFAMNDLCEAAYILGIKNYRDRSRRLIGLCQSAYIEKILNRFHMENSKRETIPMQDKLRLSKSQDWICVHFKWRSDDWKSAKQNIFAISSPEAGYIAAYDASKEAV
nr:hypothetical protein [Tanacetum cinerariifolium]